MLVEIKATYKSPCINDIVIRLFPASAGMNRLTGLPCLRIKPVPRKRGDEPTLIRSCESLSFAKRNVGRNQSNLQVTLYQ